VAADVLNVRDALFAMVWDIEVRKHKRDRAGGYPALHAQRNEGTSRGLSYQGRGQTRKKLHVHFHVQTVRVVRRRDGPVVFRIRVVVTVLTFTIITPRGVAKGMTSPPNSSARF